MSQCSTCVFFHDPRFGMHRCSKKLEKKVLEINEITKKEFYNYEGKPEVDGICQGYRKRITEKYEA